MQFDDIIGVIAIKKQLKAIQMLLVTSRGLGEHEEENVININVC